MGRLLRKGVLFTALFAGVVAPAAADPVLMFLIGVARQIVESHANRPPGEVDPVPMPDMSRVYPGTTVEPDHIRRLIDDSFTYLSPEQRREIFDALNAALMNPKNAAVRGAMIEYFATQALTVRAAQQQLAKMSYRDKERVAEDFRRDLPTLSPEDRAVLGKLLRDGLLPVPSDLNQLLLAAFDAPESLPR